MASPELLKRPGRFRMVIVVTGHMTDAQDRATPRFPESEVPRVRRMIGEQLDEWKVADHDLLICGAARGGDLLCATEALRRSATVWALLAKPSAQFERGSVAGSDPAWVEIFRDTLQRAPSWDLSQLGELPTGDKPYAQANRWMLEVAADQSKSSQFAVLAIWDGQEAAGVGGTSDLVAEARARGALVDIIDPRPTKEHQ